RVRRAAPAAVRQVFEVVFAVEAVVRRDRVEGLVDAVAVRAGARRVVEEDAGGVGALEELLVGGVDLGLGGAAGGAGGARGQVHHVRAAGRGRGREGHRGGRPGRAGDARAAGGGAHGPVVR